MTNKESGVLSIVTSGRDLLHQWLKEEQGINFGFVQRSTWFYFKAFQVHFGVSRFTLEYSHCVH